MLGRTESFAPTRQNHGLKKVTAVESGESAADAEEQAEFFLRRGVLFRLGGHLARAMQDFDRAESLDPDKLEVDLFRGKAYLAVGAFDDAARVLRRFLVRACACPETPPNPWLPTAHLLLGRAFLCLDHPVAALRQFDLARDQCAKPRPELFLDRARSLLQSGKIESALADLDQAIERYGSVRDLQSYALDLELQRGALDAALVRLDRLIEASPDTEKWLIRRGEILEGAGRRAEALRAYRQAQTWLLGRPPSQRSGRAFARRSARVREALSRLEKRAVRSPCRELR